MGLFRPKRNEQKQQEDRISFAERNEIERLKAKDTKYNQFVQSRKKLVRLERGINSFAQGFVKEKRSASVYAKELVGRPKGSYDKRYAKVGGVYNFRKQLAFQRRIALINAQKNAQLSPEEQFALRQIQENKRRQLTAKEFQTIPDTDGQFDLRALQKEIDDATNIFA